jgi:hypothetical protein
MWAISIFLTTSIGKIDTLYRKIPPSVENFLYQQLEKTSKLSLWVKSLTKLP